MSLATLLYRCPLCGHDPVEGRGDEASCPGCGRGFRRGDAGGTLRIVEADGTVRTVPAGQLTRAIEAKGGARSAASGEGGRLSRSAAALRSRSIAEVPLFRRGELVGFWERKGAGERGRVSLEHDRLSFTKEGAAEAEAGDRWELLEIRALQSSSSLIQISCGGELVQFRFERDSPRRWEDLLRLALQEAWAAAGRGTIVEFQPRIVTR
jgi:hypothetical protein